MSSGDDIKRKLVKNAEPVNEFIENIIVNVNLGIVASLKKIPEEKKSIKIEIEL